MKTKKTNRVVSVAATVGVLAVLCAVPHSSRAEGEEGLLTGDASDISATAGVRGGDVMGDALKSARPNMAAVTRMEQRKIPSLELGSFQREGKIGRYAQ